jgi:hypothetical protein
MYSIVLTSGIIIILNKYPIQLPPSIQFDFAGRIINIFNILSHIPIGFKFLGFKDPFFSKYDPLLVLQDSDINHTMMEFLIINLLDYVGWLAIFSRLNHIPLQIKIVANTHASTAIIGLLGYEQFKKLYLMDSDYFYWNLFRAIFVLSDSVIRGYYHFYVLKNY